MIEFEWNQSKARSNSKKHGVTFIEAKSVFYDEFAVQFDDDVFPGERFLMLGRSVKGRILVVVHCENGEQAECIRIISARKATARERSFYVGG